MRGLVAEQVCPRLAERMGSAAVTRSRVLRTTGIAESVLADRLAGLEERIAPVTLAYLPTFDGVDLRLTAWGVDAGRAVALLDRAVETLQPLLGTHCYGEDGDDLAAVLLDALGRAGLRLADAESCTGGLIAARLTAVPGSSAVFAGGVVAYGNEVKTRDLGVPEDLMVAEGAVSEPVVRAMVRGIVERFGVESGIAISGIAGPSGGTAEKPVGTVCIAARLRDSERAASARIPGDRQAIRARAAQRALFLLQRLLGET
jgi:nicotinamide-nucleotide amidase